MISIGCVEKKIMVRNRRRQKERLINILKGDLGSSKKDSLIKIGPPGESKPSIDREIQSKENASMVRYIVDAIIDGCFSGKNSGMGNLTFHPLTIEKLIYPVEFHMFSTISAQLWLEAGRRRRCSCPDLPPPPQTYRLLPLMRAVS